MNFNNSNYFDPPIAGTAGKYSTKNSAGQQFTFGLTQVILFCIQLTQIISSKVLQNATVNGTVVETMLNAAVVPNGQTADFTPIITLSVYLKYLV